MTEMCISPLNYRYQKEFGFTIKGRHIIIDDIRVRGFGQCVSLEEQEIEKATGEAPYELVKKAYCYEKKPKIALK